MVKLFRFHNKEASGLREYYMSYKDIAKFLNRSTSHVQKVCQDIIKESKERLENEDINE